MTALSVAACAAAALLATACGSSTTPASSASSPAAAASTSSSATAGASSGSTAKFTGCMVADDGTIDDRSFNQSAWAGMQAAAASNPNVTVKYLPSAQGTEAEYVANINTFISEKCGIIVTVGYTMAQATAAAAKANPTMNFAIVDNPGAPVIKNQSSLVYDTVEDGFLGGYLAAGMSPKTGKVGTYGGQELPTVTIYMDGFWDGVQYYNQQHHTSVGVLGWNEQTQKGEFTNSFTNETAGQTITQTFIDEGADVIFPVAGDVGLGSLKAVQEADQSQAGKVTMEWVDTDGCFSLPSDCQYFISSVTKGISTSVEHDVLAAAGGTFAGGNYIGTLNNGGVVLSPFHDFASKVPAALQTELKTITTEIENGTIKPATKSPVTG
jgi:basic membrane protein A and related proteins